MRRFSTVDEFISAAPEGTQRKLREMRATIKAAASEAEEKMSYGMPGYFYKGQLVWFALFKAHIGLFIRPPVLQEHKAELKGYTMTKSSLHLPLDKEIPTSLVKKLVRAAMKKNEERRSA